MSASRLHSPDLSSQDAYELSRLEWRRHVAEYLATRELYGPPPPVRGADDVLVGIVRPREAA